MENDGTPLALVVIIILIAAGIGTFWWGYSTAVEDYRERKVCDSYQQWEYDHKVVPYRCLGEDK